MNILLSNDDGFFSQGLTILTQILKKLGHEIFICAPDKERSCSGHGFSLNKEIVVKSIGHRIFSCSGLPADSVHLAFREIFKDIRFDLMVAGINAGANLGQDIFYSGTVAAAREAAFFGTPSIAISLCVHKLDDVFYYENGEYFFEKYFSAKQNFNFGEILNVNIPNIPKAQINGIQVADLSFRQYSNNIKVLNGNNYNETSYFIQGDYQGYKSFNTMTDSKAVENGFISETKIKIF